MKNTKRNLISRVGGFFLSGVIGLISFGGMAVEAKSINNSQVSSNIVVSEKEKKSEHLYRTKDGKCYHKDGCSYLKNSKIEVTDEEIKKDELKPCSRCCKDESNKTNEVKEDKKQSEQFYRTKTGKCYHKGNCSCLKKSKIKINQEEIEEADLKPCQKCCG